MASVAAQSAREQASRAAAAAASSSAAVAAESSAAAAAAQSAAEAALSAAEQAAAEAAAQAAAAAAAAAAQPGAVAADPDAPGVDDAGPCEVDGRYVDEDPVGLRADVAAAWLAADAQAAVEGITMCLNDGKRSRAQQQATYDDYVQQYGADLAATYVLPPDKSAHVLGLAIDVQPYAAYTWLEGTAGALGFCRIYDNEAWHFEYADAFRDGRLSGPSADGRRLTASEHRRPRSAEERSERGTSAGNPSRRLTASEHRRRFGLLADRDALAHDGDAGRR